MKKLDVALAGALTAWLMGEIWAEHLRPYSVSVPLTLLAGAAIAFRRTRPIGVAVVLVAVTAAEAAAGMSLHTAVSPFVAVLVVSWSIGAYEDRRRAVLGLTLLVCGVWLGMGIDVLRGTDHYGGTDVPWIGMLILLPGVLGMLFGSRTRSMREAQARAAQLELDRREAIVEERARIARELHDVIAHSVSVMTVQAGAAEEMLKHDPARAAEPVRAVQETGRQALVEMKRLVGMLRSDDDEIGLAPQPGVTAVEQLVDQVRGAGLPVELQVEGEPRALPIGVDLSAYRVVQEALTNALKHANAGSATVTLRYGDRDLQIEVADDGRGGPSNGGGHGLVGMRERIGIFGGTFDAGPRNEGGFAVRAVLPLESRV